MKIALIATRKVPNAKMFLAPNCTEIFTNIKGFTHETIPVTYDTCVEAIRNRTNTGFCPMEQAVMDLSDPSLAPERIRRALEKLAAQAQTT